MYKQLGRFIATFIENIPGLLSFIRTIHFKGKVVVISQINPNKFPQGTIVADVKGLIYEINCKDWIQRNIYYDVFERREIKTALKHISEGGVCMDIGANVGFYTLNMARKVGNKGKVFAFEPDTKTFEHLNRNIQLNSFSDFVHSFQLAVSDQIGELEFFTLSDSSSAWGTTVLNKEEEFVKKTVVKSTSIDDIILENKLTTVDFIKVDVEGGEFNLMKGARKSLEKGIIKAIFMECGGSHLKRQGKSLIDFLSMFDSVDYIPTIESKKMIDYMIQNDNYLSMNINLLFHPKV